MAKKIVQNEESKQLGESMSENTMVTKESLLGENPHSAYTVVRANGRYSLLRILVNPARNTVGEIEIVKDDMGKEESQEVFKINVAREIFMRQG